MRAIFEIAEAFQKKIAGDVNYVNQFQTNWRENFLAQSKIPEELQRTRTNTQQLRFEYQDLNQNFGTNLETSRLGAQFQKQDAQRKIDFFGRDTIRQSNMLDATIADQEFAESQRATTEQTTTLDNELALSKSQYSMRNINRDYLIKDAQAAETLRVLEENLAAAPNQAEVARLQGEIDLLLKKAERTRVADTIKLADLNSGIGVSNAQAEFDNLSTTQQTAQNRVDLDLANSMAELRRFAPTAAVLDAELSLALATAQRSLAELPQDAISKRLARTVTDLENQRQIDASTEITEEQRIIRDVRMAEAYSTLRLLPESEARDALLQTLAIMNTRTSINQQEKTASVDAQELEVRSQQATLALEKLKIATDALPQDEVSRRLSQTVTDLENQRQLDASGEITQEQKATRDVRIAQANSILALLPDGEAKTALEQTLAIMNAKTEIEQQPEAAAIQGQELQVRKQVLDRLISTSADQDTISRLTTAKQLLDVNEALDTATEGYAEVRAQRALNVQNLQSQLKIALDTNATSEEVAVLNSEISLSEAKLKKESFLAIAENAKKQRALDAANLDIALGSVVSEAGRQKITDQFLTQQASNNLASQSQIEAIAQQERTLQVANLNRSLASASSEDVRQAVLDQFLNNQALSDLASQGEISEQAQLQRNLAIIKLKEDIASAPTDATRKLLIDQYMTQKAVNDLASQGSLFDQQQKTLLLSINDLNSQIANSTNAEQIAALTSQATLLKAQHDFKMNPLRYAEELADQSLRDSMSDQRQVLLKLQQDNQMIEETNTVSRLANDAIYNRIAAGASTCGGDKTCEVQALIVGAKQGAGSIPPAVAARIKSEVMSAASGELKIMDSYLELRSLPQGTPGSSEEAKFDSAVSKFMFMAKGQTFQILQDAVKNEIISINEIPGGLIEILQNPELMTELIEGSGTTITPEAQVNINSPTGTIPAEPMPFTPSAKFQPIGQAIETRLPPEYKGMFTDDNVTADNVMAKMDSLATLFENIDTLGLTPDDKLKMVGFIKDRATEFSVFAETVITE